MPTNTRKLKAKMVECGITASQMSQIIGISRQAFSHKLNNKADFRATEIMTICDKLGIEDVAPYFFCGADSQNG